jgi:hypothetical protein
MIFHVESKAALGLGPGGKPKKPKYVASPPRIALGVGLVVILIVAAFVAHTVQWGTAADQFLHLTEVVVGALGGVFAGEKLALGDTQKTRDQEG